MSNNQLLVLTLVLQESDKNTFNNIIAITKKYILSLDINLKKTSILKKNKASIRATQILKLVKKFLSFY